MLKEAALRWMTNLSAQGILITDTDLTIRGWNQWLETRSGHAASAMIGKSLFAVYPDLLQRGLDKYYKDALGGQVRLLSHRLHHYLLPMPPQDHTSSFAIMQQSARIAPLIKDEQVIGTITVIDDVTERIAHEGELERLLSREKAARREAELANRTKDEFLATVSHELRGPLNAISGWVQILRHKDVDAEILAHGLEVIERNVKMQTEIIEDILDVSRIITGKLSLTVMPVNLASVIEAAIDVVHLAADAKEIRIHSSLDPSTGVISGDPARLQQVIWNLMSNAIKFTPRGGTVTVRLARAESQAEITVSDTGSGISSDFLPYVFDRFRQADGTSTRQHGGLGLGLAIVRHLVEMHGGVVRATSEGEGRGATFTVRLPLMDFRRAQESSPEMGERFSDGKTEFSLADQSDHFNNHKIKGLRVLVVDDDADAREMLEVMLGHSGAKVKVAVSAQHALDVLEHWKPDVLISDIGMPDEDGYCLINKVRALEPGRGGDIPAIALTGYDRQEDQSQALAAGYQVHLSKPVEFIRLVDAIANLISLKNKVVPSPSLSGVPEGSDV